MEINETETRKKYKRLMKLRAVSLKRYTKFINLHPEKKRTGQKKKLEIKKEKLPLTPQKHQGS